MNDDDQLELRHLADVRDTLTAYGCEAYPVLSQPAHVLGRLLAAVYEKDWRDIYLARLTAGRTLQEAEAEADAACEVLRVRRARAANGADDTATSAPSVSPDDVHARTFVALATTGALCEPCPLPWGCSRIDNYRGPGTAHVWCVFDANDQNLADLPAEVDGPAFVAWVNKQAAPKTCRHGGVYRGERCGVCGEMVG